MSFPATEYDSEMQSRCESPIEVAFAGAWLSYLDVYGVQKRVVRHGKSPAELPDRVPYTFLHAAQTDIIIPQFEIDKFRVDFLLMRYAYALDDKENEVLQRLPAIVVECDGHDFHEKTKGQATKDKSRDRRLMALGYNVVRFTGSELFRDAMKCAEEVDALFTVLGRQYRLGS